MPLTIGSRGSKLARIYAEKAKAVLNKEIIIKEIETKGDQLKDVRLSEAGGKGV